MSLIFNPFTSIPLNMKSHVRGWSMHWADMLKAQVATKDSDLTRSGALYLDHGVNFSGGMNLFGGVTDEIVDRLEALVESQAPLFSLDIPMPNYDEQLLKRIGQSTCSRRLTKQLVAALEVRFKKAETLTNASLKKPTVAIGDSHSTAFASRGSAVIRTNGQTLHGALTNNAIQKQMDALGYSPERVTLVYGSIDIRHHLGRQADPFKATLELAEKYSKEARFIQGEYCCDVEVAAPVPVEYEERKLPQTGFYQGTPFKGTRDERALWTASFIDLLSQEGLAVILPPSDWYAMDPEAYAKTYMELGSSVHIAPTYYRRFEWGVL